jgi:hypothetical protein
MHSVFLAALLLMQTKTRFGDTVKPADYSIAIHVQASHLINQCVSDTSGSNCGYTQHLDAVIDGKKYELERFQVSNVLHVGDYKARLVEDKHPRSEEYSQVYEILFSDGKTGKFTVVGESE